MPQPVDPYTEWLRIKSPDRPPSYYQLLGLEPFEDDPDLIARGAMLQMSHAMRHENGPHQAIARQLCAELRAAEECLTSPDLKARYDAQLRGQLAAANATVGQAQLQTPLPSSEIPVSDSPPSAHVGLTPRRSSTTGRDSPVAQQLCNDQPDRPTNYYELLGLKLFEDDQELIARGAMLRMSYALRQENASLLCAELREAEECLTSPQLKALYDAELRKRFAAVDSGEAASQPVDETPQTVDETSPIDERSQPVDETSPVDESSQPVAEEAAAAGEAAALADDPLGGLGDLMLERPDKDSVVYATRVSVPQEMPAANRAQTSAEMPQPRETPEASDEPDSSEPAPPTETSAQRARRRRRAAAAKKGESKPADKNAPQDQTGGGGLNRRKASGITLSAVGLIIAAIWFLPRIRFGKSEDPKQLIEQLKARDATKRVAAVHALRLHDFPDGELSTLLMKILLEDPDLKVRLAAADSLAACGEDLHPVLPQVKQILEKEKDASLKATLGWIVDNTK